MLAKKVPDVIEVTGASNNVFLVSSFVFSIFYYCNIIILYVCISIKFCLNNSSQTDTNSFLTPVFPAALLASSICNLSTSAIRSDGKMMMGTEGGIPIPVYRSYKLVLICASIPAFGLV